MSQVNLTSVEELALQLAPQDQLALMERLAHNLRESTPVPPQDLYGAWRGRFPADFDLDTTLAEIRASWQCEGQE